MSLSLETSPAPALTTLQCLAQLIAFDTVSAKSNLALVDWVRDYLATHGVASSLVPNADGTKANLIAVIGPDDRAGYVLSGHTDVVPVDGQDWSSDPFDMRVADGRAYGRGTCDMKGFLACVLAAVPRFTARPLARPIILAFSYDEEVGCLGAPDLVNALPELVAPPLGCFVGEPTEMNVVSGHKTKRSLKAHVRGFTTHSSLAPRAVNAVEYGARFVDYLHGLARELAAGHDDPAYAIGHTTAHVGVMHGGTKLNIVPSSCTIEYEFRVLPEEDADALVQRSQRYARETLEPEMKTRHEAAGFAFETSAAYPGLDTPEDAEIVTLAKRLGQRNAVQKVAFGTEAGLFSNAGIPTVVIGPGSIDQAHKPNEFVALSELEACDAFLSRLATELAK